MEGEEVALGKEPWQGKEEDEVMSEVHLGCPPRYSGPFLSLFTFSLPCLSEEDGYGAAVLRVGVESSTTRMTLSSYRSDASESVQAPGLDDDGDLVLPRRRKTWAKFKVAIQHKITSTIPDVGLQVWKAALLLADFVLHVSSTSREFDDVTALELGAGTGLVSIILARVSRKVFATDRTEEILENSAANARLNSSMFKHGIESIQVREIDWKRGWPPPIMSSKYSWSLTEVREAEGGSVLLAADVVYDDELTDMFFCTLRGLMSRGRDKVLYLALEKRYNFSLDDLDVVANGYERFRSYFKNEEECGQLGVGSASNFFEGRKIDLASFPCFIEGYDRGTDLELWKITCPR